MLVWLTDWQLAEDHLLVEVGSVVDWTLHPADLEWTTRLLGDRAAGIAWQLDTYGDAVEQPSRSVRGRVTEIRSVRCRQRRTDEGIVPATGEAVLRPEPDTSSAWRRSGWTTVDADAPTLDPEAAWAAYSSLRAEGDEGQYGFVVTVADE